MKKYYYFPNQIKHISLLYITIIILVVTTILKPSECTTTDKDGILKTVKLKHIFHHGSTRFPNLLRRKDFNDFEILAQEQKTGVSFTHTVRAINKKSVKPIKKNAAEEFRLRSQYEKFSTLIDFEDTIELIPKIDDYETLINLAKITYNAYLIDEKAIDWYDLGKNYSKDHSFGWEDDGIRGHVFTDAKNEIIIIALKGTSMEITGPTTGRDKYNDNLLFSCCCARVDRTWRGVCDCHRGGNLCDLDCVQNSVDDVTIESLYYKIVLNLFEIITSMSQFRNSKIWLIGHSLGGSLSSLLGLTYNLPVVAYEAPGERLAAQRLHLPGPPAIPYDKLNIWHIGHTADPLFMGLCNGFGSICYLGGYAMETKCHVGNVCVFDAVEKLKWKVQLKTHSIKEVIDKLLSVWDIVYKFAMPRCGPENDCMDCEEWEYI